MVVGAYLKKVEEGPRPNRPQRHVQVIYFDAEILLNSCLLFSHPRESVPIPWEESQMKKFPFSSHIAHIKWESLKKHRDALCSTLRLLLKQSTMCVMTSCTVRRTVVWAIEAIQIWELQMNSCSYKWQIRNFLKMDTCIFLRQHRVPKDGWGKIVHESLHHVAISVHASNGTTLEKSRKMASV